MAIPSRWESVPAAQATTSHGPPAPKPYWAIAQRPNVPANNLALQE